MNNCSTLGFFQQNKGLLGQFGSSMQQGRRAPPTTPGKVRKELRAEPQEGAGAQRSPSSRIGNERQPTGRLAPERQVGEPEAISEHPLTELHIDRFSKIGSL